MLRVPQAIARRAFADIDDDVKNVAANATDQLGFAVGFALQVQSAKGAPAEIERGRTLQAAIFQALRQKCFPTVRAREVTPLVDMTIGTDQQGPFKLQVFEYHQGWSARFNNGYYSGIRTTDLLLPISSRGSCASAQRCARESRSAGCKIS